MRRHGQSLSLSVSCYRILEKGIEYSGSQEVETEAVGKISRSLSRGGQTSEGVRMVVATEVRNVKLSRNQGAMM